MHRSKWPVCVCVCVCGIVKSQDDVVERYFSLRSHPVNNGSIATREDTLSPMERRMSSVDEHLEEELHSEVDDEDSPLKNTSRQRTTTKSPPTSTPTSLKLCSGAACLTPSQLLFVCVLVLIQFYCLCVHGSFGFLSRLEFLPLLLTSVSCAVGIVWSWLLFYQCVLFT